MNFLSIVLKVLCVLQIVLGAVLVVWWIINWESLSALVIPALIWTVINAVLTLKKI